MEHQYNTTCFVGDSDVEGSGTFAAVNLPSGQELFREAAFLVSRGRNLTTHDGRNNALSAEMRAGLSVINVQHKHCPACIKLVPSDTGGSLGGSEDSFWFAKAYASASKLTRAGVLELGAAFGHGGAHAVVDVVRAEVAVLRRLDPELCLIPAEELECAIHRYWANCFGQEGSLHNRASRFNHSCAPNCTRAALGDATHRAFVTTRSVSAGEELTLSYLPSRIEVMGTVVRRRHLWLSRGFLCRCELCEQPEDSRRQVECPDCASRRQRLPSVYLRPGTGCSAGGSEVGGEVCGGERKVGARLLLHGGGETDRVAFADWWNQSGVWVCRRCGWCSGPACALHRQEGALAAEIFSFVMATMVGRFGEAPGVRGDNCDAEKEAAWQAKRDAIRGMLEASLALLGRRHWTTFCCVHMRLEHDLNYFSFSGSRSALSTTPRTKPPDVDLSRAVGDLNCLWQWLNTITPSASHPPASFLCDVFCDLAVVGFGRARGDWSGGLQLLLSRDVGPCTCLFVDEEHWCKKVEAAVVECRRGASA